jgi:hypothetical protein
MDLSLSNWLRLARFSVQNPRDGARRIMAMDLPMNARWAALALMAVASALLAHVVFSMAVMSDPSLAPAIPSPLSTAVLQGGVLLVTVWLVHWVGRRRGGQGTLGNAVSLVAWLQFIMLLVQVTQIVVLLLIPPLGAMIGFAAIGLLLWLMTNFVAELHGFRSLGAVFAGIIVTLVALAFGLAILLILIGA